MTDILFTLAQIAKLVVYLAALSICAGTVGLLLIL